METQDLIGELIDKINKNEICISFEWLDVENIGEWGISFISDDSDKRYWILIDINSFVVWVSIHEFLHFLQPKADEKTIEKLTVDIYRKIDFSRKKMLVRSITANVRRGCINNRINPAWFKNKKEGEKDGKNNGK